MKKKEPSKPEGFRLKIHRPYTNLSIDTEKHHKQIIPVEISAKESLKQNPSPKRKIHLRNAPITKKAMKQLHGRDACLSLCRFTESFENAKVAATLLLLVLLSQIAHLLVGILPAMPIVLLSADSYGIIETLKVLLNAIQGPDKWMGKNWSLNRPWIVQPRLAFGSTTPSVSLIEYIGGKCCIKCEDEYCGIEKKNLIFYYPFINSAFILTPDLPVPVAKSILKISPLALPIEFEHGKMLDDRPKFELSEKSFDAYDEDGINKLEKFIADSHLEVTMFLTWFCDKDKHIKRWKDGIDSFRPVSHRGYFTQPKFDTTTKYLCGALSLFQQFLYFASIRMDWITPEEANNFLLQYWRLLLPESAPRKEKESNTQYTYDDPRIFYRFLTEYFLPTYQKQILQGRQGSQGTMGLLRPLDGMDYMIIPRAALLETYSNWLKEQQISTFDLSTTKSEAAVQRSLLEAGIPFKHEGSNPATWRYPFYGKDKKTTGGGMVNCMALPLSHLPENVQNALGTLFGWFNPSSTSPNPTEAALDTHKEAKMP